MTAKENSGSFKSDQTPAAESSVELFLLPALLNEKEGDITTDQSAYARTVIIYILFIKH